MGILLLSYTFPNSQVFQLVQGDLTQEEVDVIVNAANAQLKHGGGIAAHISRAGGEAIQRESNEWVRQHGLVSHEQPAYTSAGNLPQRGVIHAVGPVWGSGDEDRKLAAAVAGSLQLAEELGYTSIALPAISTGIFGFPKRRAGRVIIQAVHDHLTDHPDSPLIVVRLVVYDDATSNDFKQVWLEALHKR